MRIGFIGAGTNAQTMSRHFLAAGHEVVLSNSRGPDTLSNVISRLGRGASAGTRQEAIDAELVVLAVNWEDVAAAVHGLNWNGRILVDATNAHSASPPDMSAEGVARSRAALHGRTSSEIVSELAPGARVVKSISNIPMKWIEDFGPDKPTTVIFTSGDDMEAKDKVIRLLDEAGFKGIDLGTLVSGGRLHEIGAPLSGVELHYVKRVTR